MKIILLKIIKQIIYRFSERTPPNVKSSNRNYIVGQTAVRIDSLIKDIKYNQQCQIQKQ